MTDSKIQPNKNLETEDNFQNSTNAECERAVSLNRWLGCVDTIRLILLLECNMKCSYCCNEQEQFRLKFKRVYFNNIDFSLYKNICLTGGEPFLNKELLYNVLDKIPRGKNVFIYSNGLLIDDNDLYPIFMKSLRFDEFCVNIGLHTFNQLKSIHNELEKTLPVRFMVQDIKYDDMLRLYPDRLNKDNLKAWKLNDCNMPNEDWILLGTA